MVTNICLNCRESTNNPKFCDQSCAAKYNNSKRKHSVETKEKISNSIKKLISAGNLIVPFFHQKGKRWTKPALFEWETYRQKCDFYTPCDIWKLLDGYSLLLEKGWWHPIRNKTGVVRDHKLSRKDGFIQKIPSDIISHPANCKIITHEENNKKGKKSSITLKELNVLIENWCFQ